MRTVLNILNFVLGGFATTLGWLLATLVSIIADFTLPLINDPAGRSLNCLWCLMAMEAIHVDELNRLAKCAAEYWRYGIEYFLADFLWLVVMPDALQRASHNVFQSLAFLSALRTLKLPLLHYGRLVVAWVSVETAQAAREANARRRFE